MIELEIAALAALMLLVDMVCSEIAVRSGNPNSA